MSPKKSGAKPDRKNAAPRKTGNAWTPEERAAMREAARERRSGAGDGEAEVLAKIAAMPQPDRGLAERVHAIVKASAPGLAPKTWYGMPAYAKDDKVVCFFQAAVKFKARYATVGFSDKASLDDGEFWPVAFAVKRLTPATEARLAALVKQAGG